MSDVLTPQLLEITNAYFTKPTNPCLEPESLIHFFVGLLQYENEQSVQNLLRQFLSTHSRFEDTVLYQWVQLFGANYQNMQRYSKSTDLCRLPVLLDWIDSVHTSNSIYSPSQQRIKLSVLRAGCRWPKERCRSLLFPFAEPTVTSPSFSPWNIIKEDQVSFKVDILHCIVEDVIRKINWRELQNRNWTNDSKKSILSPNINNAISLFNRIGLFIANDILLEREAEYRAEKIRLFILFAEYALKLNNLELVAAIITGLNDSCVSRLKKTWSLVSKKHFAIYKDIESLVSPVNNYSSYRIQSSFLLKQGIHYVPILSVMLRDYFSVSSSLPKIPSDYMDILLLSKPLIPLIQLYSKPMNELSPKELEYYGTYRKVWSHHAPCAKETLQNLSYELEPPINIELLSTVEDNGTITKDNLPKTSPRFKRANSLVHGKIVVNKSKQIQKLEQMNEEERMSIYGNLASKEPYEWGQAEVYVILGAWGIPKNVCNVLVDHYITDGQKLLVFDASKSASVNCVSSHYRKLLDKNLQQLRSHTTKSL